MRNKRVLLVSPIGEIGGAEQVFLKLAELLPEHGFYPILACLRPGPLVEQAKQQGLEVYSFQEHRMRQAFSVFRAIRWLTNLIRTVSAGVVHANYTAHLYASPAAQLSRVPEIWHIHDFAYTPDVIDYVQRSLPSRAVIFTTEHVKSGYRTLHSRPHSVVAPICVNPSYLQSFPQQTDVRLRHHLSEGPLFLTVARLQAHKGHEYLLSAIPSVLKEYPDAVFAVAGKAGSAEQQRYREKLEERCVGLGLSEHVRFLGYVSTQDLVALFREATALVHPALTEGFGLTLLEAMALGVPVIAAAAEGPRELITHGENGLLVPVADSRSLAKAIILMAGDSRLRKLLKQQGEVLVARNSADAMAMQIVEIYKRAIVSEQAMN